MENGESKIARRPNLLVLYPDQLRRQAQGFRNEDPVVTPNIDRLAAQGTEFSRAYVNLPLCSPARAMWHTGRYPFSSGVISNCNSGHADYGVFLKPDEACLSDVLAESGYEVGYIGKWHLDAPSEPFVEAPSSYDGHVWDAYTPPGPRRHGHAFWYSYGCYNDHLRPHYWHADSSVPIEVSDWSPSHEADVAISFLENRDGSYRRADRPFALTVAMNPPHPPHNQVPAAYGEAYRERAPADLLQRPNVDLGSASLQAAEARRSAAGYFAAITGVDDQIGRILSCLSREGLEHDTLVVFSSDHGEMMGSHDRMQKSVWYEESIGVPFLMRWPGRIPAGRRCDRLLGTPDVMPSLLGLLGLGERTPASVEGTDLSRAMLGEPQAGPEALLYINAMPGLRAIMSRADHASLAALRAEPGRSVHLARLMAGDRLGARGVRTQRYTYVVVRGPGATEQGRSGAAEQRLLFDDERDPYQLENLAGADPALAEHLHAELGSLLERTRDPWALGGGI